MRNFSLSLSIIIIACSCSDNEPRFELHEKHPIESDSQFPRTTQDAINIAANASKWLYDEDCTSRSDIRSINPSEIKIMSTSAKSRSTGVDTLMYVVNYADSMGFALVPKNPAAPSVMAVTVAGHYDPNVPVENPPFNDYIKSVINYLSLLPIDSLAKPPIGGGLQPGCEKTVYDTTWIKHIPPRVKVRWSQRNPYGIECPNGIAGCSNTAVAMMMTYFEYPKTIELTYKPEQPVVNLDWKAMKKHRTSTKWGTFCACHPNQETIHLMIAQLCREIGHRSGTIYLEQSSGTYTSGTMEALKSLGYTSLSYHSCNKLSVANALDNQSMLLMEGDDKHGKGAHMWLCDGVKYYKLTAYRYITTDGGLTWKPDGGPLWTSEECYNFFHWGDTSGNYAGYYRDMYFQPIDKTSQEPSEYDFCIWPAFTKVTFNSH